MDFRKEYKTIIEKYDLTEHAINGLEFFVPLVVEDDHWKDKKDYANFLKAGIEIFTEELMKVFSFEEIPNSYIDKIAAAANQKMEYDQKLHGDIIQHKVLSAHARFVIEAMLEFDENE